MAKCLRSGAGGVGQQTQTPKASTGHERDNKVLSELRAGPSIVPMFKEVKARERVVRVYVQRVCAL